MKTLALTSALIAALAAPVFAGNFEIVDADRDGSDRLVYSSKASDAVLSTSNSANPVARAIADEIRANGDEFERSVGRGVARNVVTSSGGATYNPENFRSGENS